MSTENLNAAPGPLSVGELAFYDSYRPSLEAGRYRVRVESKIDGLATQDYYQAPLEQSFEVKAPQFLLDPSEIHQAYPPPSSVGIYDEILPHVVLTQRVLPWERTLGGVDDADPWLALLVFQENEIVVNPSTRSPLETTTVSTFLAADPELLKPAISAVAIDNDVLQSSCTFIRTTATAFFAVAPRQAELKYLAHVRQVDTGNQALSGSEDNGWFSVVVGNRLLVSDKTEGTRYYLHLVSLEGVTAYLDPAAPWPTKASNPSEKKDIALVSLYSWTLLSQSEIGQSFAQLTENFVAQAQGNPANLLLRRPVSAPPHPDPTTQQTLTRLSNGYVPITYSLPTGEETFAWYRGPLSPVVAVLLPRATPEDHYASASAVMIYDRATGVFDQSYAAAWSLGRSLALSDGSFGQALRRFRRKNYQLVASLSGCLDTLGDLSVDDLTKIAQSGVVRDVFAGLVAQDLGSTLTNLFKATRPARDSIQTVKASADPVGDAKSFLASASVQAFLQQETQEEILPIVRWLAAKQLLYDVPFVHLAPDPVALPPESLRFFYVDQNWLDVLVDGALSVGVQTSKDAFLTQAFRGVLDDALAAETKSIRQKLLGTSEVPDDSIKGAMTGLLIRSALISGWPGLVVRAYQEKTLLKTLRMDRLSDSVLLCLFLDVPDTVELSEPSQGLCFGVEDGNVIQLRQLTSPVAHPLQGKTFPSSGEFTDYCRAVSSGLGAGVVRINDGKGSLVPTLQEPVYLNQTLTSADFAVQMVKSPERLTFEPLQP